MYLLSLKSLGLYYTLVTYCVHVYTDILGNENTSVMTIRPIAIITIRNKMFLICVFVKYGIERSLRDRELAPMASNHQRSNL